MTTRPCIAIVYFKTERTDEELQGLFKNELVKIYGGHRDYCDYEVVIDTQSREYKQFCEKCKTYWEKREVKAQWHMFAQETEEDSNGNIQYPVAIIELEDGTVKSVSAENIKFIKEEDKDE